MFCHDRSLSTIVKVSIRVNPGADWGDNGAVGKYEVYKDKRGEYRFRLKAGNGEIIAVGESYKSKQGVMEAIESIRTNASSQVMDLTGEKVPA